MTPFSKSEIIQANPIGSGLDSFRRLFKSTQKELGIATVSEAVLHVVKSSEPQDIRPPFVADG